MAKIIGLTGGIGSGKTFVSQLFSEKNIPVYNTDDQAKILLNSPEVLQEVKKIFGEEVIVNNQVDKKRLSKIVFENKEQLTILNNIIHPRVKKHFTEWLSVQKSDFVLKESALIFEANIASGCEYVISVIAPIEERIRRVIQRDNVTREEVLARIDKQTTDSYKIKNSHFVIENDDRLATQNQVNQIWDTINQKS